MRLISIATLSIFLSLTTANSQTSWVHKNGLLDFLYYYNGKISSIETHNVTYPQFKPIIPLRVMKNDLIANNQILIKSDSSVFLLVNGTGRVYKAIEMKDDKIAFTRVDSTEFLGYNFGSYNFYCNDTLYSYGGYGFWHMNGHLRYFNKENQWMIYPLNKEIPANDPICFLNTNQNILY